MTRFYIVLAIALLAGSPPTSAESTHGIAATELAKWPFWGVGAVSTWGPQFAMREADNSKGVMIISPNSYRGDVVLRYRFMALTPATVGVAMLAVSDPGETDRLTLPDDYDGALGPWFNDKTNYFFAYKNAPHSVTPFVRQNPDAAEPLAVAEENVMIAGVYYDIEVGRRDGKLWLSVDGETLFEADDDAPLPGGHVALRLRGTAGFPAGCLIKDFSITTD
ncbi:MAG: hypothetical protein AAGB29_09685 [Planctomycetota bacterium]